MYRRPLAGCTGIRFPSQPIGVNKLGAVVKAIGVRLLTNIMIYKHK